MKPNSAQKRAILAALFLLATTLSASSCSMIGSSHATKSSQPEQRGIVVYAIKDIPEGYEISTEALEERELSYSKIPMDAITSASLAHGRNAKYGIASGQIISQHDLAPQRAGHTMNIELSNAAFNQIRRAAADRGQTESDLVSTWIEERLNSASNNDE